MFNVENIAMSTPVSGMKSLVSTLRVSIFFAGCAFAAVGVNKASAAISSQLISQQSSIVAENIKADAEDCAEGTKDGTIGYSIQQALDIHTELASATPNVETLFDIDSDCFSGLSQVFDLSFSIPSLGSIVSSAQDAVLQYAQKKVCTAVNKVSGMVTSPINQAISEVNGLSSFGDLNGFSNGLVEQGMSQLDASLGSQYHSGNSNSEYSVGTNPFNSSQTDFGGSSGSGTDMGTANNQINTLNQKIADVQAQIGPAQYQLQKAQQQLANCQQWQFGNCSAKQDAVTNAQNTLSYLNSNLSALQSQLASVSSTYNYQKKSSSSSTSSDSDSIIQSMGDLFNP